MKLTNIFVSAMMSVAMASDVVDLSNSVDEFNDFVREHSVVLVKFFAPWCGHCKTLAPEYEKAATELKDSGVALVEVDCTQNKDLCSEHKIQGYPSMKVFRGPDSSIDYESGRTAGDIVRYMEKELLPPMIVVDAGNFEEFAGKDIAGLALFESGDEATNQSYTAVANKHFHQLTFGSSSDKAVIAKLGVTKLPAFVIFSKYLEHPVVFDEDNEGFAFEEQPIVTHLMRNSVEPGGEIGPETFRGYVLSSLPIAYFFYSTPEQREEYSKALTDLAREFRDHVNIGFIDAVKYGSHAANINLNDKDFPAFAIHNTDTNKKYPLKQDQPLDLARIVAHVRDFADGKLVPEVKSEPVPAVQEGPVYTAVLDNYEELVLDDSRDVLVEFYAPWCGHCKKLAPVYEELGALYFDTPLGSKVAVAKMDHTANELEGIEIPGYPTLMLFPAGKKDSPIVFEGGARTLEELSNFIRDKGTHGVDGLAKPKKVKKSKKGKKSKKSKRSQKVKKDEL